MKVLFVASNPIAASSLNLQAEITALQSEFMNESVEPISFAFMPSLQVEKLPEVLLKFRPDILHISAHGGDDETLSLSNEKGLPIALPADSLSVFLPKDSPPRIIYLNACDSFEIAKELASVVPMAIGTTQTITNHAARSSAVNFYQRLLEGSSVQTAFDVCQKMLDRLTNTTNSIGLWRRSDIDPSREILHSRPELIADFHNANPKSARGCYWFQLGLLNCATDTTQIVFTTDDASIIEANTSLQDSLCLVLRPTAPSRISWSDPKALWATDRDHRLFATGIKIGQRPYTVSATLCEAVENWYRFRYGEIPGNVSDVLKELRTWYL